MTYPYRYFLAIGVYIAVCSTAEANGVDVPTVGMLAGALAVAAFAGPSRGDG